MPLNAGRESVTHHWPVAMASARRLHRRPCCCHTTVFRSSGQLIAAAIPSANKDNVVGQDELVYASVANTGCASARRNRS